MNRSPTIFESLFGVVIQPRTYLSLLYLLLAFPLGLSYFIYLVVGLSLGLGLLVVGIGFILLPLIMGSTWIFLIIERQLTIWLLQIPLAPLPTLPEGSIWEQLRHHAGSTLAWKGLFFSFLKFPLGLISFVLVIVLIALPAGLMSAPFLYATVPVNLGSWHIDTLPEALTVAVGGILVFFLSLHAINYLAYGSGLLSKFFLESKVRKN